MSDGIKGSVSAGPGDIGKPQDAKEYATKNMLTDMMIKWGVGVQYRPSEVFTKPQPTAYLSENGQGLRADLMALVKVETALAYQDGYNDCLNDVQIDRTGNVNSSKNLSN